MGGAERTARKRRQQQLLAAQAKQQPSGRKPADPDQVKRIVVRVAIAVVVLAVVVGGVFWMNASKNATEGQVIQPQTAHQDIISTREGVTVLTGPPTAEVTLDVYADFLCPACKQFEDLYADRIAEHVKAGDLRVRTHMVPMLTERSDPPGYSLDSANAGLCAADEGAFVPFHDSLFAAQPGEGNRGFDQQQLIELGRALDIRGETFPVCVTNGTYNDQLIAEFDKIKQDTRLHRDFGGGAGFGTPTVTSGGKVVDTADDAWLDKLLAAAQR